VTASQPSVMSGSLSVIVNEKFRKAIFQDMTPSKFKKQGKAVHMDYKDSWQLMGKNKLQQ
jgi:hypothetical protein